MPFHPTSIGLAVYSEQDNVIIDERTYVEHSLFRYNFVNNFHFRRKKIEILIFFWQKIFRLQLVGKSATCARKKKKKI